MVSIYIHLVVSLVSSFCAITNSYLIECCHLVGLNCLFDLYSARKKDYILHHILVLGLSHYLNQHNDIENIKEMASILLSTEISTVFLNLDSLLEYSVVKNVNKMAFISTFHYYRIYNYSYLVFNKNVHSAIFIHSRNNFEYCEIYIGIYGLFILNLYWSSLIFKKCIKLLNKDT